MYVYIFTYLTYLSIDFICYYKTPHTIIKNCWEIYYVENVKLKICSFHSPSILARSAAMINS